MRISVLSAITLMFVLFGSTAWAAPETITPPTTTELQPSSTITSNEPPPSSAIGSTEMTSSATIVFDPVEILKKIDSNMTTNSKFAKSRMVVYNRRGRKRTMVLQSWILGEDKAFSEYLAPAKERGTKMLKEGKNIWTYSPRADRVIHIAGHLLRQPIMGSDLSYEDSLEEVELHKTYTPVSTIDGLYEDREVHIMTLQAKGDDVAYAKKKLWIDKERFIPLRQEWYAKSGKLLKTAVIQEVKRIEGRWYPVNMLFKDELASGRGTEFIMDEIDFDAEMPPRIFTKQSLRR